MLMLKDLEKKLIFMQNKHEKMNSALAKISNLKINRSSKIALTITSSSFFYINSEKHQFLKIF